MDEKQGMHFLNNLTSPNVKKWRTMEFISAKLFYAHSFKLYIRNWSNDKYLGGTPKYHNLHNLSTHYYSPLIYFETNMSLIRFLFGWINDYLTFLKLAYPYILQL